jgi:hypothetical protein
MFKTEVVTQQIYEEEELSGFKVILFWRFVPEKDEEVFSYCVKHNGKRYCDSENEYFDWRLAFQAAIDYVFRGKFLAEIGKSTILV